MFLGKNTNAHIFAWQLYHRQRIPVANVVRHACRNHACVAREHLSIGTSQDNANDKILHGTLLRGEDAGNAKITNDQARMIIDSFQNGQSLGQRSLEFGVAKSIIQSIDSANSWRWLMTLEEIAERQATRRHPKRHLTTAEREEIKQSKGTASVSLKEHCVSLYLGHKYITSTVLKRTHRSLNELANA